MLDSVSKSLTNQLTYLFLNFFLNTIINFASWIKRNFEVSTLYIPNIFRFVNVIIILKVLLSAVLDDWFVAAPVGIPKLVSVLFIICIFLMMFTALRISLLAYASDQSVALTVFSNSLIVFFLVSLIFIFLVSVQSDLFSWNICNYRAT